MENPAFADHILWKEMIVFQIVQGFCLELLEQWTVSIPSWCFQVTVLFLNMFQPQWDDPWQVSVGVNSLNPEKSHAMATSTWDALDYALRMVESETVSGIWRVTLWETWQWKTPGRNEFNG